jgi:hypothetical protein
LTQLVLIHGPLLEAWQSVLVEEDMAVSELHLLCKGAEKPKPPSDCLLHSHSGSCEAIVVVWEAKPESWGCLERHLLKVAEPRCGVAGPLRFLSLD